MPLTIRITGLDTLGKELTSDINTLQRRLMIRIDGLLVGRTPVDTGRAKSNWLPSMDAPRQDVIETRGTSPQPLGAGVWSVGQRPRQMWLSNNLPYIEALNAGSSPQAPPAFIETAVQTAVERTNKDKI